MEHGLEDSVCLAPQIDPLGGLVEAISHKGQPGQNRAIVRWLDRELDREGVPRRLTVPTWWPALERVAKSLGMRSGEWPAEVVSRAERWLCAALRFARPGGSGVFGEGDEPDRAILRKWAREVSDPAIGTVIKWWSLKRRRSTGVAPPLPAYSCTDRTLAVLRSDWSRDGDLVAIDQRDLSGPCQLEVFGLGRRWLGPRWGSSADERERGLSRPSHWSTRPEADLLEWTFRDTSSRRTRSALLLRGRQIALIAELIEGGDAEAWMSIDIGRGLEARPVDNCRAIRLSSKRGPSALAIPLALPALPYATDRGAFLLERNRLILRQRRDGRRTWIPLLICWDPDLVRRPPRWRQLTVSETSKICPPETAFAARLAWGRSEGLVVYRSLGRTSPRAFLGHHTEARFLVGRFSAAGDLTPILKVDA
jgi:hypothetical protein